MKIKQHLRGGVSAVRFEGDGSKLDGIKHGVWDTMQNGIKYTGNVTATKYFGDGSELDGIKQGLWDTVNENAITISKKVGIGTTTPLARLHIGSSNEAFVSPSADLLINNSSKAYIVLRNSYHDNELSLVAGIDDNLLISRAGTPLKLTAQDAPIVFDATYNNTDDVTIAEGMLEVNGTLKATDIDVDNFNFSGMLNLTSADPISSTSGNIQIDNNIYFTGGDTPYILHKDSDKERIWLTEQNSSAKDWTWYGGFYFDLDDDYFRAPKVIIGENPEIDPTNADLTVGGSIKSNRLIVDGQIFATEVQIKNSSELPQSDYVFEEDYKLRTLEEVEQFVKTNKHLPEVPSANDFKENGYSIGQMDDILLRKVEELTLYIIAQEKRIQKLEEENNKLKGE